MGLFVISHSHSEMFTGGPLSVQIFFAISGFLISFILVGTDRYTSVSTFYLNRALRIFPVYWAMLAVYALTLLAIFVVLGKLPEPIPTLRDAEPGMFAALVFSNLFLFGQDWLNFSVIRDGEWQFALYYVAGDGMVWKGITIQPTWSLALELTFYLIAPFILFRKRLLFGLLIASLALRGVFFALGIGLNDPLYYRFFPTELAVFLLGALSHQYLFPYFKRKNLLTSNMCWAVTLGILICCLSFQLLPYKGAAWVLTLCLTIVALPFLFTFQSGKTWDKWIGELSYPIYISHWFFRFLADETFGRIKGVEYYKGVDETAVVLLATVLFSMALVRWVADPVENLRNRYRNKASAPIAASQA